MMDRTFTNLLTGVLLLFAISMNARSVPGTLTGPEKSATMMGFTVILEDATVNTGDQVCLGVSVQDFTNILGMQFSINYNPAILQFTGPDNFNLTGLSGGSIGNPSAGNITLSWSDPAVAGITVPDGTVIFDLCFNVTGSSNTNIGFSGSPTPIEVINGDQNTVDFNSESSTVVVNGGGGGGPTSDLLLTIEDASAQTGDQVCLGLVVENFDNILGMQFSINYDAAVLQFVEVTNFNLTGFSAGSVGNPTPGNITVSWSDPNVVGVTLPDGTQIVEFCFNVTGSSNTQVAISGSPTPIEVVDGNQQGVTLSTNSGTVTISGGGGGGDSGFDGFGLILEDVTAQMGDQICLGVTVQDFTNILGMQFSINYNPSILQFVEATNFNLTGFSAGSTGNPSAGNITVSWSDPNVVGITLPDGTQIVQLCFNVIGNTNTNITFSGSPTPIEVVNGNQQGVDFHSNPGVVTIMGGGGGGPGFTGFGLIMEDITTETGNQICLGVTVQDFDNILGMQFSINYDTDVLEFVEVTNFNLAGLSGGSFGNPTPGNITVSWSDLNAVGITLPNGTQIFEVCFNVTGTESTTVVFSGMPTPIEVVDGNQQTVVFHSNPGVITIGEDQPPVIVSSTVVSVSCNGENDGSVAITEVTGTGPFTYQWSAGTANGASVSNLSAGMVTVTVTDAGTGLTTSQPFSISQPNELNASLGNVVNVDCAGDASGSITVSVTGGTSPYGYNWSGSLPDGSPTVINLPAGTYSVTVTDAKGCTDVLSDIAIISQFPAIQITNVMSTNISAGGSDGTVSITVSGGAGNFSYSWTGPGTFTADTKNIGGLNTGGEYCVTVTDGNGCTESTCAFVGETLEIDGFTGADACEGQNNGSITITVVGGQTPYNYNWSGSLPDGSPTVNNLAPGNYFVTVTDNSGQQVTGSFEVGEETIEIVANQNGGTISLTFPGSTGVTVLWDDNTTGPTISGLAPGSIACATITYNNGFCSVNECYSVPDEPLVISNISTTGVSCFGDSNGTLTLSVTGGVAPYRLFVSGMMMATSNDGNFQLTDLAGGSLSLEVRDASNTPVTATRNINEPAEISVSYVIVNDTEDDGCTGSVTLDIVGGSAPFDISWNTNSTGPNIIALCEGVYTPTILDDNGCPGVVDGTPMVMTLTVDAAITNTDCVDDATGSIDLTVAGPAPTYKWVVMGTSTVISEASVVSDLAPGSYTVTVTDATGASMIRNYVIETVSDLAATVDIPSDYNGFDVSCADASDGRLTANVTGNSGTIAYEWLREGAVVGMNNVLVNAGAGTYTLRVFDDVCVSEVETTLTAPTPLEIEVLNLKNISCLGEQDGEIAVKGGGGISPYVYRWSNNDFGAQTDQLTPGSYIVTVTDENDCLTTGTYTIEDPGPIQVTIQSEPETENCNGELTAIVTGGNGSYNYNWTNIPGATGSTVSNLCHGEYFLEVTDALGCENAKGEVVGIVADKRFPCFTDRSVLTPDGDGLNENFIIFCSEDFPDNHLEIYNRWGQLVYEVDGYDCTALGGMQCFTGRTNRGEELPEGPYYYVLEYTDPNGELVQVKGSITLLRD